MKIDFVSDVVCPWCAIGLNALEQALTRLGDSIPKVELHFQPFELNPTMPREGEDIEAHIARKYGLSPEAVARNRERIRAAGESVGFTFRMDARSRIYNTLDAHRLLHWAGTISESAQRQLKHALLTAYFTEGRNPSSRETLRAIVAENGLDTDTADTILSSDAFATDVRERQDFYRERGISGVPAIIIDDQHLIEGGQPVAYFEQALRKLAEGSASRA